MKKLVLQIILMFFVVSGVFAQKFDDITIESKELKQKREIVVTVLGDEGKGFSYKQLKQ